MTLTQMAVIIGIVTFGIYALSLRDAFVSLDDGLLIYQNFAVLSLTPHTLLRIFTSYDPELYVPLTLFTYQLNHLVGGLSPIGYHLVNLLLHIGNAILVLLVVEHLSHRRLIAFICALLFAIHPIQVEAVAWAAARKDVLAAFFGLSSMLLYLVHRERGSKKFLWWGILCFGLGLLSKVSIITLPVVFLLIDWKDGRASKWNALKEKIPYGLLFFIFAAIAIYGKTQVLGSSGFVLNVLLAAKSTAFYLWKMIAPIGFSVIYPQSMPVLLTDSTIALSLLFCLTLVMLLCWMLVKGTYREVAFTLGLYLLFLVPNATNFYKNGFLFFASDRYAYLASIGVFYLFAMVTARLLERPRWSAVASAFFGCVVVVCLAITPLQARTWLDSEVLYRNVIALYPDSALAHNNLGDVLVKAGREPEAIPEFQKALQLDPHMMSAHINMGDVFKRKGDLSSAEVEYKAAVQSIEAKASLNLDEFAPYYFLGELYEQTGNQNACLVQFQRAVERGPNYAETHYNLALKYHKFGHVDEAAAEYAKAIALDPTALPARYHFSALLSENGHLDEAVLQLQAIVAVDPQYEEAAKHLAAIERIRRGGNQ